MSRRKLSSEEARRAVYFDFECRGRGGYTELPVLLGAAWDADQTGLPGDCKIWVTDPGYWSVRRTRIPLAGLTRYTKPTTIDRAVMELVRLCDCRGGYLVSWSEHDLRLVERYCSNAVTDKVLDLYANAIPTAKRWLRFCRHAALPRGHNSLDFYARQVGFRIVECYGSDQAAPGLNAMAQAIQGGYQNRRSARGEEARRLWRVTLGHNVQDCRALSAVTLSATRDLERL